MACPLMSDAEAAHLDRLHGPAYAAWERFARWLRRWRRRHPEDDRGDLELVDEYVADLEDAA